MPDQLDLAGLIRTGDRIAWSAAAVEPVALLALLDAAARPRRTRVRAAQYLAGQLDRRGASRRAHADHRARRRRDQSALPGHRCARCAAGQLLHDARPGGAGSARHRRGPGPAGRRRRGLQPLAHGRPSGRRHTACPHRRRRSQRRSCPSRSARPRYRPATSTTGYRSRARRSRCRPARRGTSRKRSVRMSAG